jgi:hypothetical protein
MESQALINNINYLSLHNREMAIENHQQGQVDAPSRAKVSLYVIKFPNLRYQIPKFTLSNSVIYDTMAP